MLDALLHELAPPHQNVKEQDALAHPIGELRAMIAWRIETLTPYLHALAGKAESGHNCTLCSGGCDMQHQLRLTELKEGHKCFMNALADATTLQPLGWLATAEAPLPAVRGLRIIATAIEMIHTERTHLVPLIHKARKDIYADAQGKEIEPHEGERGAMLPLRHTLPAGG
jgi:hypothetical protein